MQLLFLASCLSRIDSVTPGEHVDLDRDETRTEPDPTDDTGTWPCGATTLREAGWLGMSGTTTGVRGHCETVRHSFGGPAGAVMRLTLTFPEEATLTVHGADETHIAEGAAPVLEVQLPWPGEFLVDLSATDPAVLDRDYTLSVSCVSRCDGAWTRYPLVLMHGFAGTDAYLDAHDYFYGVADALEAEGYAVSVPAVDAFASTEVRAAAWVDALVLARQVHHARKLNLIAHSQGGIDARAVVGIEGRDDLVASITTISSPHHGSSVADVVSGGIDLLPLDGYLIDEMVDGLSQVLGLGEAELSAQMAGLTTESMATFNAKVPDHPDIVYRSWAGRSCGYLDFSCQNDLGGETIDALLLPTFTVMSLVEGDNDGMVPTESAEWGWYQGVIGADHFDQIGQIADDGSGSFDHVGFYLQEAETLRALGL